MAAAAVPIITLSLQLATALIPEVAQLVMALKNLRSKGMSEADLSTMVGQMLKDITAMDADALATLDKIPPH